MTAQEVFDVVMGVFATVVLFLYGLQSFSREIQELGEDRLQRWLARLTSNRISGFALGAVAIVIGANAGTTVTGLIASISMQQGAKRTSLTNLVLKLNRRRASRWLIRHLHAVLRTA